MLNQFKEWWSSLATDLKVIIVLMLLAMGAVIYFCGVKGNNSENFYYKGESVAWGFPHRPNVPITKKSDAQVDTSQLKKGINIVKGKLVIKTT